MLKRDSLIQSPLKPIRSFIARSGRKTARLQEKTGDLWQIYGLSLHTRLNQAEIFSRVAPLTLEIGFGNGQALLEQATTHPEQDFIGVEVYKTGILQLLAAIQERSLTNVRIYHADAVEVLTHCLPDSALQRLQLFFPDPWPKVRHHKRRLVQPDFVALVARKVACGGILHMATDWQEYAEHMLAVVEASDAWENASRSHKFSDRPESRILTKFEQRGQRLGHGSWDLIFRKRPASNIL